MYTELEDDPLIDLKLLDAFGALQLNYKLCRDVAKKVAFWNRFGATL
jgi:hypothetical protein